MNKHYTFHDKLILRTPRLPLCQRLNEKTIYALINDDNFLEAIYLASPVLYEECIKWKAGRITDKKEVQKIIRSLSKYYSRMTSRCTPFGLFSGCNVVAWSDKETKVTISSKNIQRHTRFDMHYLCALAQKLATLPGIKENLLYYPNSSIYCIGDEIRYIEYKYINAKRSHQISSVLKSDYLNHLLQVAGKGAMYDDMVRQLTGDDIMEEEAIDFVNELITAQLLVSELEPAITGPEFIYQVIHVLKKIQAENEGLQYIISILEEADRLLHNLDNASANEAAQYRQIMALLDKLEVPYEENKLFQTDTVKVSQEERINNAVQLQLQESLTVLNKLCSDATNQQLLSFAKRFYERYEDKEMPLLEVLDTETGIGYLSKTSGDVTPLIEDIVVPNKQTETNITWGKTEQYLHTKIQTALKNNDYSIDIKDDELKDFTSNWNDLPPSFSVTFRIVESNSNTLYLENAGGSSAANLLGRFAHANTNIHSIIKDITKAEQENDPEVVYAEIVHLPESRIGNILLHPAFRNYEIPYLAQSSVDNDHRIDVQDICISVVNYQIVLRSRRLGRRIIPRLSTAHNYSFNALPVYQFLCDLQTQGKRGALRFHWGSLVAQHQFLPRVMYNNTILSLATWGLLKKDYEQLLKAPEAEWQAVVKDFRAKWNLPRYVVLADGDNELLVDFENHILLQSWIETIKNRSGCILKEFFYQEHSAVTDENGHAYTNQFIAVLTKFSGSYPAPVAFKVQTKAEEKVQRNFIPGSEWLYYKIYCGIKSADKILLEAVKPLTEDLLQQHIISEWFFIRYQDPEFHLRLRFRLIDAVKTGAVIKLVHQYFSSFKNNGYIWKLQIDTYNREIERYGSHTIELAETIFLHDSTALLQMLDKTWGDEREKIRWLWGMRSVEELLNAFRVSLEDKLLLLTDIRQSFATEFNMDKALKVQLTDKHRDHRQMIEMIMDKEKDSDNEMYPLIRILEEKSAALQPVVNELLLLHKTGQLQVPLFKLMNSYIHMLLNRLTTSNARLHEMVIYDFLFRYYQSQMARRKSKTTKAGVSMAS